MIREPDIARVWSHRVQRLPISTLFSSKRPRELICAIMLALPTDV